MFFQFARTINDILLDILNIKRPTRDDTSSAS